MKRKWLAVGIILLFIGVTIAPSIAQDIEKSQTSRGNWLYVGGSGPGNYSRIQDAINVAHSGDTIFVYNGTYYECIVIGRDKITLMGQNRNSTIIDGGKIQTVFCIGGHNCSVSNFTLINCREAYNDWDASVLYIHSNGNIIENNKISCYHIEYNDDMAAIDIRGSYNKILRNRVYEEHTAGRLYGIVLQSNANYNIISQNNITDYTAAGIIIEVSSYCNLISKNQIHDNRGHAIWDFGENTTIINNIISRNTYGILCEIGSHSKICNNIIQNTGIGIHLSWAPKSNGATYYIVSKNLITDNPTGLSILDSYHNTIEENNFINNSVSASFTYENPIPSHNKWKRNYWSDSKTEGLKLIRGEIRIILFYIPWFNIDWNPAKEPYDIPEMS